MKKKLLLKFLLLLFFCGVNLYSQNSSIDVEPLILLVKENIDNNKLEEAQELLDELSNISVKDSKLHKIAVGFYQSEIHIAREEDEQAMGILLEGFTMLQDYPAILCHSEYAESIGRIFSRAKNYDAALRYFNLGLQKAKIRNDSLTISSANLNIGSVHQMRQNIDSAGFYYEKAMEFYPKTIEAEETLATAYSNLMGVAVGHADFVLAEDYGMKSLEIHKKRNDTLKMAGVLSNLGSISMYNNNLEKSNEYYFEAYELLVNNDILKAREIKSLTLDNISQVYYLKEEFKTAYDYLFKSTTLEKEIIAQTLESKITEIAIKYDISEKEKATEIEKNNRQKAEFYMYILGGTIIILLGFLWLIYRANRLKREKLALEYQQEKSGQIRKIEHMQNEVQIKILNATLDGKEAERRHIAEILHDNVSTLLSSANMHLYAVKTELKSNAPKEVAKIEMIIAEAADKIRDLSHELISSVLLKFGLRASVEDLCEKYSNSRLEFKCENKGIDRYDQSFEIKVHNIIEELVNNIMKHSNAYNASIKLKDSKEQLVIRILDDGDGFDVNEVVKKDGLGLSQIAARVKVMKGVFEIKSYENTGTQIFIKIPIPN